MGKSGIYDKNITSEGALHKITYGYPGSGAQDEKQERDESETDEEEEKEASRVTFG